MDDNHHQPPKRVVVCGGGIIGVCTAYFLAKKGAAVTLVERSSIAGAASGKAGAFLAHHMCDSGALSSLARASFDLHRALAEELGGSRSYGYRPLTTLTISVDESEPPSKSPILPLWVDGKVQTGEIIGTTETTAQIHPQLFTRALLAKAVAEHGVEVVMAKVEGVVVEKESIVLTVDGGGVVRGDAVVLALGPWTSKLSDLSSKINVQVHGKKVHSLVVEPKNGDTNTPHALVATYYPNHEMDPVDPDFFPIPTAIPKSGGVETWFFSKPAQVQGMCICGPPVEVEIPDEPESVRPEPDSIQFLKSVAGIVSSYLVEDNVTVKSEVAGIMPCTDDELPIMGEVPGMKGCYVASGHGYWGILFGPASGAAMAELVLDGHATIVDLDCFSPNRFAEKKA